MSFVLDCDRQYVVRRWKFGFVIACYHIEWIQFADFYRSASVLVILEGIAIPECLAEVTMRDQSTFEERKARINEQGEAILGREKDNM